MPRCIECMAEVPRVVNPETNTVERCPVCSESVDTYVEFGNTQKWIDMALLQKRVWAHTICNEDRVTLRYMLFAVLCCALEAFVVRSCGVLAASTAADGTHRRHLLPVSGTAHGPSGDFSLQIVKILQDPVLLGAMQYAATVPRLFFYAVVEYLLLVAVAVWLGSHLRPKAGTYEEVVSQWARAMSLAASVKIAYTVFFIWNVPVSLLPVVNGLFLVWLGRGIFVVTIDHSWVCCVPAIALCLGAHMLFRHLTHWNTVMLV